VFCPAGTFLIGTIRLLSHVDLHLSPGCVLPGSARREHYSTEWGTLQEPQEAAGDVPSCFANVAPEHLVCARNAVGFSITGSGAIDGNGEAFFLPYDPSFHPVARPPKRWRPLRMLAFRDCREFLIENVRLLHAPAWTLWLLGCSGVKVCGVDIVNDPAGPNTDGIDIDCSRNVLIANCHINAGDDCIAVKSSVDFFDRRDRPCEDVTVSNCTLVSTCNGIRLGYEGDGPIRNMAFSNLVITGTRTGINILVPRHPRYGIHHGPAIENILFSNIVMETRKAFFLWIGDGASAPGCIRNIRFTDITATSCRANYLGGTEDLPIEGISFSNLRLVMRGEMDDHFQGRAPMPYKVFGYWLTKGLPFAFYCRHVKQLSLRDVQIEYQDATGSWRAPLRMESVAGLLLDGIRFGSLPAALQDAPIHLTGCRDVMVRHCELQQPMPALLRIEGAASGNVALHGNWLGAAIQEAVLADGAQPSQVGPRTV
jgi:polygalacturonase